MYSKDKIKREKGSTSKHGGDKVGIGIGKNSIRGRNKGIKQIKE